MLTEEENRFIEYWEQNRKRKKRWLWQLAAGLPLGVSIAAGIFMNIYADWFKGASTALRMNTDRLLVILAGVFLIVVFVVVFSAKHKWDMHEQRYKELLIKKGKSA